MEEPVGCEQTSALLIVEEDPVQLSAVTSAIEEVGLHVIACATPSEALTHFEYLKTGVVVMDPHSCDPDYAQLLDRIANAGGRIRVVFHTACRPHEPAGNVPKPDAFAFVEKQADPQELRRQVLRASVASLSSCVGKLEQTEQSLQDSDKRFRDIFANSVVGMYRTTPDGRILMANKAIVDMLGYGSFEELAQRNLEHEGFEPEYPREEFKRRIAGEGQVIGLESRWLRRDGTVLYVRESARVALDERDEMTYYEGTVEDITERKRMERALRESEEKYRNFFEDDLTGNFIATAGGKLLDCNQALLDIFGFESFEEAQSTDVESVYPNPQARKTMIDKIRLEKTVLHYEQEMLKRTGESIWVVQNTVGEFDDEGELTLLWGHIIDVTDRKRAEQAALAAQQLLERTFAALNDAVFVINPSTRIVTACNEAVGRVFGYKVDEVIGRNTEFLHVDRAMYTRFGRELLSALDEAGMFRTRFKARKKDGTVFVSEHTVTEFCDEDKNRLGLVSVVRDVTELAMAEQQRVEYQAKLKAMTSEMLTIEDRERRRIAVGIHDDICQNLVASKLALETSFQSVPDADMAASLKAVTESLCEIIEQAESLTFSLSNPILHELGFVAAVREYLNREVGGKHGISVELRSSGKVDDLDEQVRNLLFRISRELLVNVVKHARASSVKVGVDRMDACLRVSIRDDGIGFQEAAGMSAVSGDARFGLFSIREQLEGFGGRLEIESGPGQGTTATIFLPLKDLAANGIPRGCHEDTDCRRSRNRKAGIEVVD